MRKALSLAALFALATPAYAWNDAGHMVAARLSWKKLDAAQQDKAVQILKKHPHYDEYLSANRPNGFTEPEWVFLRAATWPDWVKGRHREFSRPARHYINYPFVLSDSKINPSDHQPPAGTDNIVQGLDFVTKQIKNPASQEDQAVHLCWLLHLGGDVHQPLHATALFSKQFPQGDRGGNLAYVVLHDGANKTKLHPMWDGLLGKSTTPSAIDKVALEVTNMIKANPGLIQGDLDDHKTFESWVKESFEVAKKEAYLDGNLPLGDEDDDASDIEVAPDNYAKNAGRTARIQIAKAGARLATTIADVLK